MPGAGNQHQELFQQENGKDGFAPKQSVAKVSLLRIKMQVFFE